MLDELLAKLSSALSPDEVDRPQDKLIQARTLLREGQFAQAAPLFAEITNLAREKGMPGLAGETALRAAQCYVRAGDIAQADRMGQEALRSLIQAQRYERAAQVAPRIIQALERNDRHREAQILRQELRRALPPGVLRKARRHARPRRAFLRRRGMPPEGGPAPMVQRELPSNCSSCGAPARSDEVDWIGETEAACAYCGAALKVTLHKIE